LRQADAQFVEADRQADLPSSRKSVEASQVAIEAPQTHESETPNKRDFKVFTDEEDWKFDEDAWNDETNRQCVLECASFVASWLRGEISSFKH